MHEQNQNLGAVSGEELPSDQTDISEAQIHTTSGKSGALNRRTISYKANILEASRRAELLLEMSSTEIGNASLGLYSGLANIIGDGGEVEIFVHKPGVRKSSDVTPVEFRLLGRVIRRVQKEAEKGKGQGQKREPQQQ